MIAPHRPQGRGTPRFVHLHVHSAYSLLAGASRVESLVAHASAQGCHALALTDTNAAYGLPTFQACCDAVELRALHGAEIHDPTRPDERAVVLAQDAAGYRSLCRLLTRRHLDTRFSLVDDLPHEARGLVVLTPSVTLLRSWAEDLPRDALYAELIAHDPDARQRELLAAADAVDRPVVGTHRVFFDTAADHATHRLLLAIGQLKFLRAIR
ncbi:MAG: PHP domain-containing protein, partial [Planctomycetota bacterium]|nr:PHP domain-containing protein [Planctomycetota bacterium]